MQIVTAEGLARKAELQKLLAKVVDVFNQNYGDYPTSNRRQAENEIDSLNHAFKNIISAIRGPDFKGAAIGIKWNTTAKIRWIIGLRENSRLDVNPEALSNNWLVGNQALMDAESPHFAYHIEDAIRGLEVLLDYRKV